MPTKTTPAARNDSTFRASRRTPAIKPGRQLRPYPDLATLSPAKLALVHALAACYKQRTKQAEPAA
jgi:hypothetical protein